MVYDVLRGKPLGDCHHARRRAQSPASIALSPSVGSIESSPHPSLPPQVTTISDFHSNYIFLKSFITQR